MFCYNNGMISNIIGICSLRCRVIATNIFFIISRFIISVIDRGSEGLNRFESCLSFNKGSHTLFSSDSSFESTDTSLVKALILKEICKIPLDFFSDYSLNLLIFRFSAPPFFFFPPGIMRH